MTSQASGAEPERGADGPAAAGEQLRKARLSRGLSLETAHKETKIPRRFLEALEDGKTELFPAAVYVQGSLRTYAEYLDLDAQPLLAQLLSRPQAPEPEEKHEPGERQSSSPASAPRGGAEGPAVKPLVLALILAGGALCYWLLGTGAGDPAPSKLHEQLPAGFQTPAKDIRVDLRYKEANWARVVCDDIVQFEGRVPALAAQSWHAKETMRLRFTSEDSVEITLDGRRLTALDLSKNSDGDRLIKQSVPKGL